jgi:hypothetical protein
MENRGGKTAENERKRKCARDQLNKYVQNEVNKINMLLFSEIVYAVRSELPSDGFAFSQPIIIYFLSQQLLEE